MPVHEVLHRVHTLYEVHNKLGSAKNYLLTLYRYKSFSEMIAGKKSFSIVFKLSSCLFSQPLKDFTIYHALSCTPVNRKNVILNPLQSLYAQTIL